MSDDDRKPAFELVQVEKKPSARQQWLVERQGLVGASEVATLFGLDPYGKSIAELFDEKVGVVGDDNGSPDMERGRYLEDDILEVYMQITGRIVIPMGLRRHRDEPRMGATPDGEIAAEKDQSFDVDDRPTVEVKSVRLPKFAKLKAHGLSDGWILQVQAQLEVCNRSRASFVFHNADSWQMVHFDIERNREMGAAILAKIREFWREYIETGRRPAAPLVNDLPEMPKVPGQVVVRDDPAWHEAVSHLLEARELKRSSDEIAEVARDRLKALMGGFGVAEGAGIRAYFQEIKGRSKFDQSALEAARPLDGLRLAVVLREAFPDIDLTVLADVVERSRLDLSQFTSHGKPFPQLRTFFLKEGGE